MQYHLDTIPVLDAFHTSCDCPICDLYAKAEADEIDKSLGGSVMEPDVRIRVNEVGFCCRHNRQLFGMQNRLGHALMIDSHSKELLKKLDSAEKKIPTEKKSLFGKEKGLDDVIKALEDCSTHCIVCENVEVHMTRYLYTILHLWKTSNDFRELWQNATKICLPHSIALLRLSQSQLSSAQQNAFAQSVLSHLKAQLTEDEKDLEWFTLKFDYRNQAKPWGNSKDALERTVNLLRSRCIQSGKE